MYCSGNDDEKKPYMLSLDVTLSNYFSLCAWLILSIYDPLVDGAPCYLPSCCSSPCYQVHVTEETFSILQMEKQKGLAWWVIQQVKPLPMTLASHTCISLSPSCPVFDQDFS